MSYANIFSGSKIASQYLPTEAVVTPTLAEVLTAGDSAGGQSITDVDLLIVKPPVAPSTGTGSIQIYNSTASAKPTYYEWYNAGATGGGLDLGNLQLFGYSTFGAPTTIREIWNSTPEGDAISLGDGTTVGGAVISVNGSLGAGRVYDTVYNKPPGAVIQEQVVGTSKTVGGGGDEVQVFQIPTYVNDKYYRVTINYSLRWTGGAGAPGATDAVYFFADPANISGTVEDAISSSWIYLSDIQNAGSGSNTDRTYCGSFVAVFKVNDLGGTAPPRIFMGSSATTGVSGTDLDISLVGTDTINVTPTRAVWEQLTF